MNIKMFSASHAEQTKKHLKDYACLREPYTLTAENTSTILIQKI